MSEAKIYTIPELTYSGSKHSGKFMVEAADYYAAVARETALHGELASHRAALREEMQDAFKYQQRALAAEQRNTERDTEIAAQVESALRRSFTLGQIYWQQADSDSTCQQNKCDQTMETQAQHILNVLKSVSAALNPKPEAASHDE